MRAEAAGNFKWKPVLLDHPRIPGVPRMKVLNPLCLCSVQAAEPA